MTKIGFWNVNRKPLERLVAKLAHHHELDLVLLAESEIPENVGVAALEFETGDRFRFFGDVPRPRFDMTSRLHLYARLGPALLEPLLLEKPTHRMKFFRLHATNPSELDTLLVLVHAPSKSRGSWPSHQRKFFRNLAESIEMAEKQVDHCNTILVGDLNVDPFEQGVPSIYGIQGVSAKGIALQGRRTYAERSHRFFYNPMWGVYGDRRVSRELDEPETPGTYFLHKELDHHLYWHMYDQVLIRPDLVNRFPLNELKIVGQIGDESLLGPKGWPSPSDHLPIRFQVELRMEPNDALR